jgi:hypothetical protein
MFRFRNFLPFAAVLVGAAVLGAPSQAHADFLMRISDGVAADTLLIRDNTAAGVATTGGTTTNADGNATLGVIVFSGSIGEWAIVVNTGMSTPVLTPPGHMDLNFVATKLAGSAAQNLTIEITDQGFTSSPLPMLASMGGTLSGSVSKVVFETGFSNSNTPFTGAQTSQTFTISPFAGSAAMLVSGSTPYSLTERVIITGGEGAGTTSADGELTVVPAPATLALALAGMPLVGFGAWVRRRKIAA